MNITIAILIGVALGWILRGLVQYFNKKNS